MHKTLRAIDPVTVMLTAAFVFGSVWNEWWNKPSKAETTIVETVELGKIVERQESQVNYPNGCTKILMKVASTSEKRAILRLTQNKEKEIPVNILNIVHAKIKNSIQNSSEYSSTHSSMFGTDVEIDCKNKTSCFWITKFQEGQVTIKSGNTKSTYPFDYPLENTVRCE